MIDRNDNRTTRDEHESVWQLLPWYANATLQPSEALRVERHLATCAQCTAELERSRRLSAATKDIDLQPWSPSPAHFARVLAHVDDSDHGHRIAATTTASSSPLWSKLHDWISGTPRPVQWAFAVQGTLVLVLAVALVLAVLPPASPYQTLSHTEEPSAGTRARVRIVLADDITGARLRDLLQSVGGEIVHGPSQTGVYTVELPFGRAQEPSAARALELLRANPGVRLAEPIGSGAP